MRKRTTLRLIGLLVAACGGGPGSTPQATIDAAKSTLQSKDGNALYDMLSPEAQKRVDQQFQAMQGEANGPMGMHGGDVAKGRSTLSRH